MASCPRLRPRRLQQAKPFSPASILKFGPEIKNRCTKEGINGENLTSIPKSSPEIKNRCTQQGINRQNLALILKFGPEIENRCTNQPIFSTHSQHIPPARIPARVPSRVDDVSCLGCSAWGRTPQWFDSGSTVAAKAGADAPGGGISLCFCRRGCAAPVQKPPRSTPCRSEKNRRNERTAAAKTHPAAKITVATKSSAATKKPVPTLRSSSAAPGRAKISKGIGITLPEASYGFRQSCRNRESAWP